MEEKKCRRKDCNRPSISRSLYCGQHTNNRDLIKRLKNIKAKKLKSFHLDEVELKKIVFTGKYFDSLLVTNTDMSKVVFEKCHFQAAVFEHVVFDDCQFMDCTFEQLDMIDTTSHKTLFRSCQFTDSRFSESLFADDTAFVECNIEASSFAGGMFSETGMSKETRFLQVTFTQVSFNQAHFESCRFIEVSFSKTTLYDSIFHQCNFDTVTHDFKLSGVPFLSDFRGSKFINTTVSKDFRKWNNLKKSPLDYYLGIVEWLTGINHPNYLSELTVALNHLQQLAFAPTLAFNERIKNLFNRLVSAASESGDYRSLGDILSDWGGIPLPFRSTAGFFLPPPQMGTNDDTGGAKLTIKASLQTWTLERVSRFIGLLAELERQLPVARPQQVLYIEQGSIIVDIWGGVQQLLTMAQSILNIKGTRIDNQLKSLDYEKKQIELEEAKLGLLEKKLDFVQRLKKDFNFDYLEYRRTEKGQIAAGLSEVIQSEFPILDLKIEEPNQPH